jgi:hypothetical protein
MMSTQERLRAAAAAAAATVRPGSAPPLRLPDDPAAGPHLGGAGRRRWLRALTPLAAAAAVAAVVIISLTLTSGVPRSTGGAESPARSEALASVPPYSVALTSAAAPAQAVIRSTATGAVVATVKPPRPYGTFNFVSGAADDQTFIIAAQRWWHIGSGTAGLPAEHRDNTTPVVFFRLRFDPATRTARLTLLHLAQKVPAATLSGMAVSADGTRLALALHPAEIEIVTLATGSARHWIWPVTAYPVWTWIGNDKPSGQPVSWTANGRHLAFPITGDSGGASTVMVLDTRSPGGSMRPASRPTSIFVGHGHFKVGPIGNALITPDGSMIITIIQPTAAARSRVLEMPLRRGEHASPPRAGTTGQAQAPWNVLWTDASGSSLIIATGSSPSASGSGLGILHGGRFTPLPGTPVQTNNVAW